MRILAIIPRLVVGGAERMVARLAGHLTRWGHTVMVVAMFDPLETWIEAELRAKQIPLRFLGKKPGLDGRMVPRIARMISEFEPDVIHTHLGVLKYVVPAMLLSRRRPVVHTLHTLAEKEADRATRLLNHVAFRSIVTAVAIGDTVAASVRATYHLEPARVIPNGIPVSLYAPSPGARDDIRQSLGLGADAPVFVSVAMLTVMKNHETLIAAFAAERLRDAGAVLLLAGDDPERRPLLERHARELGCADRVRFLGVRSDVPRLLAAADAFVLASHYEGNPLSVMEAMAAGKCVIAPAVGCIPELAVPGTGRLLRGTVTADALASAMLEVVTNPAETQRIGAAAAQRALHQFDDAVMARAYETLYREITPSGREPISRSRAAS